MTGELGIRAPPDEVLTMPIYEFYCSECHAVFDFFAKTPNTKKRPACPRCGRPKLDRKISRFAISKGRAEPTQEDGLPAHLDETKMERLFAEMAQQAEGTDEEDPRQAARFLRGLHEGAGMPLGPGMEEAIRRMEAGEVPEKIEEEMGDVLDLEEPLSGPSARRLPRVTRKRKPPRWTRRSMIYEGTAARRGVAVRAGRIQARAAVQSGRPRSLAVVFAKRLGELSRSGRHASFYAAFGREPADFLRAGSLSSLR